MKIKRPKSYFCKGELEIFEAERRNRQRSIAESQKACSEANNRSNENANGSMKLLFDIFGLAESDKVNITGGITINIYK